MFVYVLECSAYQDNDDIIPVVHGVFSTREKAEAKGKAYCQEDEYLVGYEITEVLIDE